MGPLALLKNRASIYPLTWGHARQISADMAKGTAQREAVQEPPEALDQERRALDALSRSMEALVEGILLASLTANRADLPLATRLEAVWGVRAGVVALRSAHSEHLRLGLLFPPDDPVANHVRASAAQRQEVIRDLLESIDKADAEIRAELRKSKLPGYPGGQQGGTVGDAEHDLNAVAARLGLTFEEAKAKLTARKPGRKVSKNDPVSVARRVVRRYEQEKVENPALKPSREVLDAFSIINKAN
jgi:hypothetical protein